MPNWYIDFLLATEPPQPDAWDVEADDRHRAWQRRLDQAIELCQEDEGSPGMR